MMDSIANAVTVVLNRGHGTFGAPDRYRVGKEPTSLRVADLDGDGNADVVTVDYNERVSVLLNGGNGRFAAKVDYPAGGHASNLAIGDVDGGGTPDLAVLVADDHGASSVSVLRGKGDGTFSQAGSYRAGEEPASVAIRDLNGDGAPELVTVNHCGISAIFGHPDGTFGRTRSLGSPLDCPSSLAIGDLDADGKPDLVTGGETYPYPSTLSVLLNRGAGAFGAGRTYESHAGGNVAIGDLNGDGRPDLASANYNANSVSVLINTLGVCRVRHFRRTTLATAKAALARALPRWQGDARLFGDGREGTCDRRRAAVRRLLAERGGSRSCPEPRADALVALRH